MDHELYRMGQSIGVEFLLGKSVGNVVFEGDKFTVELSDGAFLESKLVLGAYGKRSDWINSWIEIF